MLLLPSGEKRTKLRDYLNLPRQIKIQSVVDILLDEQAIKKLESNDPQIMNYLVNMLNLNSLRIFQEINQKIKES